MMILQELSETQKPYRIFTESLEKEAIQQFVGAMMQDSVLQGALMPDAHTGYTIPIGAVVAVQDMLYPSFVGYDIGCGMCAIQTTFHVQDVKQNAQKIFDAIYRNLPVGQAHNKNPSHWDKQPDHTQAVKEIMKKGGLNQLGTLGSGNHFVEIGEDEAQRTWIVVHSGSRNIGHSIATHYMKLAAGGKAREGFFGLQTDTAAGEDYLLDLEFGLAFALENRIQILRRVTEAMQNHIPGHTLQESLINRHHNHAEKTNGLWIHRKGATHAEKDMMGVIPGNMRDGSFIVRGKGNADSLSSSSHGAGRVMGRKAAKKALQMDDFIRSMQEKGITAKVTPSTLDESPGAYKNIWEVMALQSDLVEVCHHVKPIINIKG